jgi:hypothetical protein
VVLDLSRINWTYIAIGFALWLIVMVAVWKRKNYSTAELYLEWRRQNDQPNVTVGNYIAMPDGPGSSTRWESIFAFTLLFAVFLFLYLIQGCKCLRW